jgi:hypothetical protein
LEAEDVLLLRERGESTEWNKLILGAVVEHGRLGLEMRGVFVTLAAEPGCALEVQLRLFVPMARVEAWPPAA